MCGGLFVEFLRDQMLKLCPYLPLQSPDIFLFFLLFLFSLFILPFPTALSLSLKQHKAKPLFLSLSLSICFFIMSLSIVYSLSLVMALTIYIVLLQQLQHTVTRFSLSLSFFLRSWPLCFNEFFFFLLTMVNFLSFFHSWITLSLTMTTNNFFF